MSDRPLDPIFKCKLEIIARKLGLGNKKRFIYFCVNDYCLRNKHIVPSQKEIDEEMNKKEKQKIPLEQVNNNLQDD